MSDTGRGSPFPWRAFLCALFLVLLYSVPSESTVYRYVDEDGSVNLTDSMESVPKKYRDSVKEIDEDDLDEAGVPFPKTEEDIEREKKPLNRAVRYVKSRLRGKGRIVALVAGIGIVSLAIVLAAVRKRVLRYILLFAVTFVLFTALVYLAVAAVGDPSIQILNKALGVFTGKGL